MEPMDLHTHSNMSDGTCTPSLLVEKAKAAGLGILALTDHDCIQGIPEAMEAGERLGIRVIPGLELDTEFHTELHMLGLGVDPQHPALQEFAARNAQRRQARNEAILNQLAAAGVVFSGLSPDGRLVEAMELPGQPFYLGVQYHPEFKSRPDRPHPVFAAFVAAAGQRAQTP